MKAETTCPSCKATVDINEPIEMTRWTELECLACGHRFRPKPEPSTDV